MQTPQEPRDEGELRLTPEYFLAELYRLSSLADCTEDPKRRRFYKNRVKLLHQRWKKQAAFDKREAKREAKCLKQQGS